LIRLANFIVRAFTARYSNLLPIAWYIEMKKIIIFNTLILMMFGLNGCGQKGPLIVDRPALETPKTQEEELAPTK